MTVLVCTPAYAGLIHVGFFRTVQGIAVREDVGILVVEGESSIWRARNNLVQTFLNETDFDTLAFIDADIEMAAEDFDKLAQMSGVRGAAVAMKTKDGSEFLSCWVGGNSISRNKMPSEPFRVDFLGAAVLFIDRDVFARLTPSDGAWNYFPEEVVDGNPLSEDYGFCNLCKSAEIEIYCHPDIMVTHYGTGFWRY